MESFEHVYKQYAQFIYKFLLSNCHDESIAQELTQETFYQAYRSLRSYDGSCKVSTWLCSIAKRLYAAYLRKHPSTIDLDDSMIASAQVDPVDKIRLHKAIRKLSEAQKEVIYLRMYGDLSFAQIGEVMEHSENWSRVTFYRAKEKLRKEMENDG
ncbi:RNA polymerase sigma factor [Dubosiella newyorkensis]|uniref:RNA polymerase sigma factor n=1 Tax=Dubosiella newyorkensis TaxID=1862672 RepID=UPI00248B0A6C|nr:sigma-70 family RNA polymerase sigma factor [Dubosiella newyorkensis]